MKPTFQGRLLVFHNCQPQNLEVVDSRTLHCGLFAAQPLRYDSRSRMHYW
eukprot:SAG31_NODE_33867_length_339_cov_0.829167_2_plen_49_part_01